MVADLWNLLDYVSSLFCFLYTAWVGDDLDDSSVFHLVRCFVPVVVSGRNKLKERIQQKNTVSGRYLHDPVTMQIPPFLSLVQANG